MRPTVCTLCLGPGPKEVPGVLGASSSLLGAFVLLVRSANHHLIENMESVRHVLIDQFQMDFLILKISWIGRKQGFLSCMTQTGPCLE